MVWLYNRRGVYTVRFGYHLARQVLRVESRVEASNRGGWQLAWRALWKLKLMGKIKIFSWRACHDVLPTRVNLAKRKIISDTLCHYCKSVPEDTLHVIRGCGAAQDVWAGSLNVLQKFQTNHVDFLQLFEALVDKLSTIEMKLFLVQVWLIWNQRNVLVYGGQMKNSGWLTKRATELLEEYKKAQATLEISRATPGSSYWKPLSQDVYKLNFDAVVFSDLNFSRAGAII